MELLATHPGKRRAERFWLAYTPVWAAVSAVVMIGGFAERWGDGALLAYGVAVGLPALVGPLLWCAPEERALPWHARVGTKYALSVTAFALLLNYSQTPFFYDVLHMHYGFRSTVNIRNNPLFLYFVTIAYFATYAVLLLVSVRVARALVPRGLAKLAAALSCVVVAALETALNANPFTRRLFCYDDLGFALWFGSLAYGLAFLCILPVWLAIEEREGERGPGVATVLAFVCAAVYVDSLLLDLLRAFVAPHFTTVLHDANGLGDVASSCLARP